MSNGKAFIDGFWDGFGPVGLFFLLKHPSEPAQLFADEPTESEMSIETPFEKLNALPYHALFHPEAKQGKVVAGSSKVRRFRPDDASSASAQSADLDEHVEHEG
jgi:hypothetical protein